jgi:hypothetical protein
MFLNNSTAVAAFQDGHTSPTGYVMDGEEYVAAPPCRGHGPATVTPPSAPRHMKSTHPAQYSSRSPCQQRPKSRDGACS